MNNRLTFQQLREANVKRCEEVFHKLDGWTVNDWTGATIGEVGEAIEVLGKLIQALNTAKKLNRLNDADKEEDSIQRREELKYQLGREIADAIIYGDLLIARLGMETEMFVVSKFNEVSQKRGSTIFL